jgi:hypothetical protein
LSKNIDLINLIEKQDDYCFLNVTTVQKIVKPAKSNYY